MILRSTITALVFVTAAALAQQPNSPAHSMTINGVDGPPYPITSNDIRTSTLTTFTILGASYQPYAIYQASTLSVGAATVAGCSVDLALTPVPALVIDGFAEAAFRTAGNGTGVFSLQIPDPGYAPNGVPLGLQLALQAVVADPTSSDGYSLTAATRITVVQGPTVPYLSLGDEYEQSVTFANMPLPFYGNSYTRAFIGSNGYVSLGASLGSDPTASPQDMLSGPPRIAAQWCDLYCPPNGIRATIDANPGPGAPAYLRIDYLNVQDWLWGVHHDFSILLRADGYLEISSSVANNIAHFDQMAGIAPGYGLGGLNQAQKNFTGAQPAGSNIGPGILTTPPYSYVGGVNEAFYEWYGLTTQNPAYLQSYDNPFDLIGVTLHFLPTGSGGLPGSTNRYALY